MVRVIKSKNYATDEKYKMGVAKRLIGEPFYDICNIHNIHNKKQKKIPQLKFNKEIINLFKKVSEMETPYEIIKRYLPMYLKKKVKVGKIDKVIKV